MNPPVERRRRLQPISAGSCALIAILASPLASLAQSPATNVPDSVTRQSGLRVAPMSRAARTYAANCQGCHGDGGASVAEIPSLVGRVGYFVRIPEGRKYLVQVPNVALNPSSDQDIAEMLNWVLTTYSRPQLPADFEPYTAAEVAALRQERIDVSARREAVIEQLIAAKQIPSADVLAIPRAVLY